MENLLLTYPKQDRTFIDTIISIVCKYKDVSREAFQSKTRKREVVEARQIAMKISKIMTSASLATIGEKIGSKDHATVLHACKTVDNLCDTDAKYRGSYSQIYIHCGEKISTVYDTSFVCNECGSMSVQIKAWVNINTRKYIDEIESPDPTDHWCPQCHKHVLIISRSEYVRRDKEMDELEHLEYEAAHYDAAQEQKRIDYEQQLNKLENELEI